VRDVSGDGRGAAEGNPLTMSIHPIGTRRQMETQKFRNSYIGSLSTTRNTYTYIRCTCNSGGYTRTRSHAVHRARSVLVIFTRQTISRGIESSGFYNPHRKITVRADPRPRNAAHRHVSLSRTDSIDAVVE